MASYFLIVALVAMTIPFTARAELACTLISDADTGTTLYSQGACNERSTPASTFKIAISVMGFDSGILAGAHAPAWPYREEYKAWREEWKTTVDPTSWLRDSVVWYSRSITNRLGKARFQKFTDTFDYGNRDLSGDPALDNGLTTAWLSGSLQISPAEEVTFLRKLIHLQLPASAKAQEMTLRIMPRFAVDGWTVQGKTGGGFLQNRERIPDYDRQIGWFVGWASKRDKHLIFARRIADETKIERPAGFRARDSFISDFVGLLRKSGD